MNRAFAYLSSCIWSDYDESKVDIIKDLPFEVAVMILRLLDPRDLVSAILVSRHWHQLIRSDVVLRRRVYDELCRERLAYRAAMTRMGTTKLFRDVVGAEFLRRLGRARHSPGLREITPRTMRGEMVPGAKGPLNLMRLEPLPKRTAVPVHGFVQNLATPVHGFVRNLPTSTPRPVHGFVRNLPTSTPRPVHGFVRNLPTSTPRMLPSTLGKMRPGRRDVNRPTPLRSKYIRL